MRVFVENFGVYGVRKVWRQMNREGFAVARCTIARLMRDLGLQGVIRGKPVRTTISNKAALCPLDHVTRRGRRTILCHAGRCLHGCVTETKQPPADPARFRFAAGPHNQSG